MAELDRWQKEAVTAEGNCVVTAGAGAGKTTVLAERYLYLVLSQQIPVTDILVLTFTKKAAAEMYERIYQKLAQSEDTHARSQLAIFAQAKIMTLDSFCSSIVRKAASDYGYSPEFSIDDVSAAEIAEKTAFQFVMTNRDKPAIDTFLQSHQMEAVVKDFFASIGTALVTPVHLAKQEFSPMESSMRNFIIDYTKHEIEAMRSLCDSIKTAGSDITTSHADCKEAIFTARQFPSETADVITDNLQLLDAFVEKARQLGMRGYGKDPVEISIKESAKELRKYAQDFAQLKDLIASLPFYAEMLHYLDEFAQQLAEKKRLADIMDFKDLGQCAVDLLMRRIDIRQELKTSFQKIMIDEFQDNNEIQKSLLFLLAEKQSLALDRIPTASEIENNKLFFVGDEKQSIYRFRGADVSVFKRLSRELTQNKDNHDESPLGKSLVLQANYRSSASLITFFNQFFSSIMASDPEQESKDFYAHYEPMSVGNELHQNLPFPSLLKFYELAQKSITEAGDETTSDEDSVTRDDEIIESLPDSEYLTADESEALAVAKFIQKNHGVLDIAERDGTIRKASYSDFAILLRKTSPQHLIERYLRHLAIPFRLDQPRDLFKESIALDLYNIFLLLAEPANQAAFAAVLRSPLCRISDAGFAWILSKAHGFQEIPETIQLSEYDSRMVARGTAFFNKLADIARDSSLTRILDYVWNYSGLRLDFLSRPESRIFMEHYDFIFSLAASIEAKHGTLSDFIDELEGYIDDAGKKFEPGDIPRESESGVRIMTIHKAKGLEFPIVIVPFVQHQSGGIKTRIWGKTKFGIALGLKNPENPESKTTNLLMTLAQEQEKEEAHAEVIRLLYVACTRAENHLIFFGRTPSKQAPDSFYHYLISYFDQTGKDSFEIVPRSEIRTSRIQTIKPDTEAFLKTYLAAHQTEKTEKLAASSREKRYTVSELSRITPVKPFSEKLQFSVISGNLQPILPAKSIQADIFGTLCHEILSFGVSRNGLLAAFLPSPALREALPAAQYQKAIEYGTHLAQAFFATDFWKNEYPEASIESEKPFLLKSGDCVIEGRMDLVIETNQEVTILDFKTGQEEKSQAYAIQLAIYCSAMRKITHGKIIKAGIYWLESGSFSWLEGSLEEPDIIMLTSVLHETIMQ